VEFRYYAPSSLSNHNGSYLNQALVAGVENGVPNSMAKVEKTHMAHGVEFRSPFTDIDLVNYAFSLPENYKIRRFKEKYILRQALLPLLPKEIANRAKFPQRMDYDHALSEVLMKWRLPAGQKRRSKSGFLIQARLSLRNRPTGSLIIPSRQCGCGRDCHRFLGTHLLDDRRRPAFKFC
jgi:asparagine synthetase B (glutamine-hydrolysing)